jgi:response regulator NasT
LNILLATSDEFAFARLQRVMDSTCTIQQSADPISDVSAKLEPGAFDILLVLSDTIDLAAIQQLKDASDRVSVPIVVFVSRDPENLAPVAIRLGITSFVVDGFEVHRVPTLIEVTLERFKLNEALRGELMKSQEELAARKVIERAKGILMQQKQSSEQEAYRTLRELAMRQSKPIKEVAETLILYSDALF